MSTNENTFFLLLNKKPHLKVNIHSVCSSEGHIDSGYEDSATSVAQVTEPAIQKLSVHVEESVSEDLLNEIFHNGSESLPVALPQKAQVNQ